jgi:hypothetical protein
MVTCASRFDRQTVHRFAIWQNLSRHVLAVT